MRAVKDLQLFIGLQPSPESRMSQIIKPFLSVHVHDCYGNDIDIPDSYIQLIKPQLKCNSDRHKYMLFQITLY